MVYTWYSKSSFRAQIAQLILVRYSTLAMTSDITVLEQSRSQNTQLGKDVTNPQNFLTLDLGTTKVLDYFRCILFLLLRICAAFLYYFEDTRLCSKTTTFQTLLLERMLASGLKSKLAIISSPLTFCPTAMILVHYATYFTQIMSAKT